MLGYAMLKNITRDFDIGEDFAPHAGRLRVLHSDMIVGKSADPDVIYDDWGRLIGVGEWGRAASIERETRNNSGMAWEKLKTGERPLIAVVGEIRNESELAWARVQVEVQFRDGNGKLVDTATCFSRHGVALPGRDMAFKATVAAELPLERYASWEVFVRYAEDPKRDW